LGSSEISTASKSIDHDWKFSRKKAQKAHNL
jgi:hypothetical protein